MPKTSFRKNSDSPAPFTGSSEEPFYETIHWKMKISKIMSIFKQIKQYTLVTSIFAFSIGMLLSFSVLASNTSLENQVKKNKSDIAFNYTGIDFIAKYIKLIKRYDPGDTGPAGGFVFYVTNSGFHGLEAAPNDQNMSKWGCAGIDSTKKAGLYTGKENTKTILKQTCGGNTAAKVASNYELNGFRDWYLPSKYELELMFAYLYRGGTGNFLASLDHYYWSSSEGDSNSAAWSHCFCDYLDKDDKDIPIVIQSPKVRVNYVRAVRSF
ncbi:trimeric autotransporter adhesin [Bathymodiolus japonicus methanotrophic gill symbiont]|uniref:DUF1566 domain-containing protein n=1 Tax=Bathymodiolus japonicus methanotrophic gill symbiont TaxID=113269 RepID=UPI001B462C3B|nr:DUF1566 domain-containing protein [Bathymodiolus japonicus methanotrophic gill symbiont]GFO72753.1 trimeric autotransporter adhesin [Bathymodiolus japonicus methanotrophic gill symbiont]